MRASGFNLSGLKSSITPILRPKPLSVSRAVNMILPETSSVLPYLNVDTSNCLHLLFRGTFFFPFRQLQRRTGKLVLT